MTSGRVSGLLLAAGEGRRYGRPKALVDDGAGPWVLQAARALLVGGCRDVVVVTGAAAPAVEDLLARAEDQRIASVRCGTWEQGMGESLRSGLTALATRGRAVPPAVLVHLVDLPDVGAPVIERLLGEAGSDRSVLTRAAYRQVPGHPVLIGRDHWQGVMTAARGDFGARGYLRRARPRIVECGDLATGTDVDVPLS